MKFEKYPFEKLNELLNGITPNNEYSPSILTIGEPKFNSPKNIIDELCKSANLLNKYPKSAGEDYLKNSQINFFKKRFNIELNSNQIIPTLGTREVLFNFPQFYLFDKTNPHIAFTNPFYQIYEGAAIASRAKITYLNLTKENNFLPKISDEELKKIDLVILNYPNNPTSAVMPMDELKKWVERAIEFDFCLINDECYSEIYTESKPFSLLQACIEVGNKDFKNCLVLNSISKRNSAPGLRSGFIAGDSKILNEYKLYRTYVGAAISLPLQKASCVAWSDFESAEFFRQKYTQNLNLAKEILGVNLPKATFYIWLEVGDELNFTKELFKKFNIKVLPGSFLGRDGQGSGFVRIALVEEPKITKEVLNRVKEFLKDWK